jgi:hypothetical protein
VGENAYRYLKMNLLEKDALDVLVVATVIVIKTPDAQNVSD